jgi:hypothetical protein
MTRLVGDDNAKTRNQGSLLLFVLPCCRGEATGVGTFWGHRTVYV